MALELKVQGNRLVSESKFEEALAAYSQALNLCHGDEKLESTLLSNRSHCLCQLERYEEALEDARHSSRLRPLWYKPYTRCAQALAPSDPKQALHAWLMAVATRQPDLDLTHHLVEAMTAVLNPHVDARQEQLDRDQLFFTNLFLCPHTGGILFNPSTLLSGITVNRAARVNASATARRMQAAGAVDDPSRPFVHCLEGAAESDVAEPKINIMLRDVLVKVFPSHYESSQRVADLNIHIMLDNADDMSDVISKCVELWNEQPTCYLAWCLCVLLNNDHAIEGLELAQALPTLPSCPAVLQALQLTEHPIGQRPGLLAYLASLPLSPALLAAQARSLVLRLTDLMGGSTCVSNEDADVEQQLEIRTKHVQTLFDELTTFDASWLGDNSTLPGEEAIKELVSTLDPSDFDCKLCYSMVHNPVALPCGHVFCGTCVERFLDHKPNCPVCRTPLPLFLAARAYKPVRVLHDLTRKLYPEILAQRDLERQAELDEMQAWMPVFVCNTALPSVRCPLHVFEPRYRLMLRRVMETENKEFGMCVHTEDGYSDYGTLLKVNDYQITPDGRSYVDCIGTTRFRVLERSSRDDYNVAKIEPIQDQPASQESLTQARGLLLPKIQALQASLPGALWASLIEKTGPQPEDIGLLTFWFAGLIPFEALHEALLPMEHVADRATAIHQAVPNPDELGLGGMLGGPTCVVS
eukprot:m.180239 g.180239  ORF g.180239 m.180239 type:complete len:696 (+) comp16853_c0_seq7:896-2983(+)